MQSSVAPSLIEKTSLYLFTTNKGLNESQFFDLIHVVENKLKFWLLKGGGKSGQFSTVDLFFLTQ